LETILGATLPDELVELWRQTSGLRLFEDAVYGQWGLVIWSVVEMMTKSPSEVARREVDFGPGDVVIGKFLGDQDRLMIRCEKRKNDFGSVLIELEMDPREEWPVVARSLSGFLEKFLSAWGDKFWEP